jgi:hypothetical protein
MWKLYVLKKIGIEIKILVPPVLPSAIANTSVWKTNLLSLPTVGSKPGSDSSLERDSKGTYSSSCGATVAVALVPPALETNYWVIVERIR